MAERERLGFTGKRRGKEAEGGVLADRFQGGKRHKLSVPRTGREVEAHRDFLLF